MIAVIYSEYKHCFITNGKIGTSSLVSLPSPVIQMDRLSDLKLNYKKNQLNNYKIVLMLRNPKERFRSGLFTTLFFDKDRIDKSEAEWKAILTDYLSNTGMFNNSPTRWEEYHCMPWLYTLEDFIEEVDYTPVHINHLSRYLADNGINDIHENNTDRFDNKVHFYNAFDKVIENYKTQYDSLFEKDMEMYYKWLVGEYVC